MLTCAATIRGRDHYACVLRAKISRASWIALISTCFDIRGNPLPSCSSGRIFANKNIEVLIFFVTIESPTVPVRISFPSDVDENPNR